MMALRFSLYLKLLPLLLLLFAGGCAVAPSVDQGSGSGGQQIFRHRWWSYYTRALAAAERQNHSVAISDLRTAIEMRDRDQRMARTYGMHFIDYFPHRELGILYWESGRLTWALEQLETSVAQAPSSKALYYLDQVRKKLLHRKIEGGGLSPLPPSFELDIGGSILRTREDAVVISGSVADPNFVASVTVHGDAIYFEGARREVAFRKTLMLPQGKHSVTLHATSLTGLSAATELTVHIDRQGPVVIVQAVERSLEEDSSAPWVIEGRVIDASNVAGLYIDGMPVRIPSGTDVPFRIVLDKAVSNVDVVAIDQLGNETAFNFDPREMDAGGRPPSPAILAYRGPPAGYLSLFQRRDRQPPTINLKGWTDRQTVYLDKIVIEGSVSDHQQIKEISVDGRRVVRTPLAGIFTAFNCSIELSEGENVVTVSATDTAGNRTKEEIIVIRRQPAAMLLDERLSVSVLPFGQHGEVTPTSDAFHALFMQALASRNRFKLLDRTLFDVILQEHKISRTDLIEPETALRTGRLATVHAFVSGSIIETRLGVEVLSRLIDTETAEVLTIVDAFIEADTLSAIKETAEQLALKLHREFPLVDGAVLSLDRPYVVTDLGSERLKAQRRILIITEKPVLHPVTRHPLGKDFRVVGHARLVRVDEKISKGKLITESDQPPSTALKVITQ